MVDLLHTGVYGWLICYIQVYTVDLLHTGVYG